MTNDVIKLNTIVEDFGHGISELSQIGQDSFKVPLVTTPGELAEMAGLSLGFFRPLSHNLIWFYALKTTVYARQMLEEAGRIFEQVEDAESAHKVQSLTEALDTEFQPSKIAIQVYSRLLDRPSTNGSYKE